ncbi:uncharacterized protein BX664DRAFT_321460 [Halteromyces radiatus]|uniref:uncharacterized protein n=1 Tax=Halteromyces radiatus TaxID=101107 RepID=UPI002221083F|nr:uncharacterized protein BX664DRAFT_321460 [Halteromyces radiatus]KAI8099512.1 hypothetical protein BX664DRAFT_321460 [Halteromyces radiatus]
MHSCIVKSRSIGQRLLVLQLRSSLTNRLFGISCSRICHPQQYKVQRLHISHNPMPKENVTTTTTTTNTDLLLNSMEGHRPTKQVISESAFAKLEQMIHVAYTVPQLKLYLKSNGVTPSHRKSNLIKQIMVDYWKLTTPERKRAKELSQRKNNSRDQFQLQQDEMFFILQDNGNMIRDIEQQYKVRVRIGVTDLMCTLEGQKSQLPAALVAIREAITLERQRVRLVDDRSTANLTTDTLAMVPQRVLDDLSKTSGAYISLDNNQISLAAPTKTSLSDAKRKLAVFLTDFGFTSKRSLQPSDYTAIQHIPTSSTSKTDPLIFLPLHDTPSMPLAMKTIGWSRVCRTGEERDIKSDASSHFHLLGGDRSSSSSELSPLQIKDMLQETFKTTDKKLSIEATFGQLLFQNPTVVPGQTNLLIPEIRGCFNLKDLEKLYQSSTCHRRFFSGYPPSNIRPSLLPLTSNNEFHQRIVRIGYIDSSLLCQLMVNDIIPESPLLTSSLQRLQLEFIEKDDGTLEYQRTIAEHERKSIDLLGVSGNVDVRLTAKEYSIYDNKMNEMNKTAASLLDLVNNCRLDSYSELSCPTVWKSDEGEMTLLDVTFNNESRYRLDDNLVTLRYVDEQQSRTRRAEMKMVPYQQETEIKNEFDYWDGFWIKVIDLAQKWNYRS